MIMQGLVRSDNKRPDGLTITPWANGQPLVWDVTYWDSFAPMQLHISLSSSIWCCGLVAERAARRKRDVYKDLPATHVFIPIAFELTGVFGNDTRLLIKLRNCS